MLLKHRYVCSIGGRSEWDCGSSVRNSYSTDTTTNGYCWITNDVYFMAMPPTQVFHLDMGTSTQGIDVDNRGVGDFYRKLYNIGKADNDSCMTIMSQVAQRLVTLCCTMNEYPYVRFSKNHSGPGIVAQKFQVCIDHTHINNILMVWRECRCRPFSHH